jgi:hypothetical protein
MLDYLEKDNAGYGKQEYAEHYGEGCQPVRARLSQHSTVAPQGKGVSRFGPTQSMMRDNHVLHEFHGLSLAAQCTSQGNFMLYLLPEIDALLVILKIECLDHPCEITKLSARLNKGTPCPTKGQR